MKLQAFTENSKTILSVDFDRRNTCIQMCSYCYVDNMERRYLSYLNKIKRNNSWAVDNPENFARQLDNEYSKCRSSKSKKYKGLEKLPVRIYGSGDYITKHYEFLNRVNFKFFIISKNLTEASMKDELERVLLLPNCTRVVLSFDNQNVKNYEHVKHLYGKDGVQFAFTGDKDDWHIQTQYNSRKFGIFFNIGKKKVDVEYSKTVTASCPALSKKIGHDKACSICSKCWKSSKTRGDWNT